MSGMRIFKTKPFSRFADREGIEDGDLCGVIAQAEAGLGGPDLGGGVIKLRIARRGQGKSGGFRSIVLFRHGSRAFFVYGFAKNERDNIRADELKAFRKLADHLLNMNDADILDAIKNGTIKEIEYHG